jgi:membrane associated rhomboid family serine protease
MITILIISVTTLISFIAFSNEIVFRKFAFKPYEINKSGKLSLGFLTHGFIHADIGHLFFNMLTLYFFGSNIEKSIMSETEYSIFYLSAIVFASAIPYQNHKENPNYISCGASGAVSAVLFVLVFYEPWSKLYLHFFIPIYYILFAIGYVVYSWYMSKKNADRIAHDVHLYGALFGIAYILLIHPESLSILLEKLKHHPF